MSLAQRFERRLEGLVGGAFARVFKGQVQPVEIGDALQREAGDKRNVMGNGQVLSPNRYRVTLSPEDYDRLTPWETQLTESLAELVQDYLDESGWSTIGDIEVYLAKDDQLHLGVFGVASRMEAQAPPRKRPYDSLSLPAMPVSGSDAPVMEPAASPSYLPPVPTPAPPPPPSHGSPLDQFAPPPVPEPQLAPSAYSRQPAGHRGTPWLTIDQTGERYELRHGSNVVGRGTDADLQLLDQGVSRRHADIQHDGNATTVYDLGSTNGTSVNGHEVGSHRLRHGDVIRLGHTRLVFQDNG